MSPTPDPMPPTTQQLVRAAGGVSFDLVTPDPSPPELTGSGVASWCGVMHLADGEDRRTPRALDRAGAHEALVACLRGERPWADQVEQVIAAVGALEGAMSVWEHPDVVAAVSDVQIECAALWPFYKAGHIPPDDLREKLWVALHACTKDLLAHVYTLAGARKLQAALTNDPTAKALRQHAAWADLADAIERSVFVAALAATALGLQDVFEAIEISEGMATLSFVPAQPDFSAFGLGPWDIPAAKVIDRCLGDREYIRRVGRTLKRLAARPTPGTALQSSGSPVGVDERQLH